MKSKHKGKSVKAHLIPNNYKGKTPEQVWSEWTTDQKMLFYRDHMRDMEASLTKEQKKYFEKHPQKWEDIEKKNLKDVPDVLRDAVIEHVSSGQYKDGGFFSKAKELAKSGAAHAKSAYEKAAPHVKKAYEKGKEVSKKAYETTKRTVKQKIHDEKKKIALEVIDDTKDKFRDNKQKITLAGAEELVEEAYKDGGSMGVRETLDERINALKPGEELIVSKSGDKKVVAERSADGKTLKFVRENPKGFEVIKTTSFYEYGGSMATGGKVGDILKEYTNHINKYYESGIKRFAGEKDMIKMFTKDKADHLDVISYMKDGDFKHAYRKWANMDTASRDEITPRAYELLMEKSGYAMEKGGKTEKVKKCPSGTKIQTLILSKDRFKSEKDAKGWAHSQGFKFGDVDEKEDTYRFRQEDPSKFKDKSFRTIKLTKGVQSVIGCPVGGHTVKSKLKDGGKPKKKEKYENGASPSQLGRKPGSIEDLGVSTYIKFLERCMEYFENDPLRDDIEKEINLVLETEDGQKRAVKYYQDKTWHKADIFRKAGAEDLAKAFIAASNKAQDSLIPLDDESTDEPNDEEKAEMWYDTVDEEELNAILIELGYEPSDVRMDGGYPTWDKLSVETRSDLKRHAKKNNLMEDGGKLTKYKISKIEKYGHYLPGGYQNLDTGEKYTPVIKYEGRYYGYDKNGKLKDTTHLYT